MKLQRSWLLGFCRRRPLLTLAGLILLGLGTAGALRLQREYKVRKHREAGMAALKAEDFAGALTQLEAYLAIRPEDPDMHRLAAGAARQAGDYENAELHLGLCERLQAPNDSNRLERALLQAQQGDLGDHEAYLHQHLHTTNVYAPQIIEALAQGYVTVFEVRGSLETVHALVERRPKHGRAMLWRGKVWYQLGDRKGALDDYRAAVALTPNLIEARLLLADLLLDVGEISEARSHYESLNETQPEYPEALLGLARCCIDLAQREEATRQLDRLLAKHPDHVAGLLERGRLALRAGQADRAAVWLRHAHEREPYNREATQALIGCLKVQGKTAEAQATQEQLDRNEAELGRIARLKQRYAFEAHEDAILCFRIGTGLLNTGQGEMASRWLLAALKRDPRHVAARRTLADYFERSGWPLRAAYQRRRANQHARPSP